VDCVSCEWVNSDILLMFSACFLNLMTVNCTLSFIIVKVIRQSFFAYLEGEKFHVDVHVVVVFFTTTTTATATATTTTTTTCGFCLASQHVR